VSSLRDLHAEIVGCTRCPRLRAHCADVAAVKRAAYRDERYWGRPLPGFGDPAAPAIRRRACSSSASPRARTAPTAPAACSPATAPVAS
jgi:hypothetical protein